MTAETSEDATKAIAIIRNASQCDADADAEANKNQN